jgi:hypothetical protein
MSLQLSKNQFNVINLFIGVKLNKKSEMITKKK